MKKKIQPKITSATKLKKITTNPELESVERVARLLDGKYRIPFTPFRFGWDFIIGLVPVAGDTLVLIPSVWMIWKAWQLQMPNGKILRMAGNTALDYFIGTVPVLGDIFDATFKANLRNAALLREHLTGEYTEPSEIMDEDENVSSIKTNIKTVEG